MFESRFEELDVAEHAREGRQSSLLSTDRRLIRAFGGRFCFDFGLSARCFETKITLKEGETHKLGLSLGAAGATFSVEKAYTLERTIEYGIGNCDSIAPVLCYEDAMVEVYERTGKLLFMDLSANEVVFSPGTRRPFIAGNKELDDPECGCANAALARGEDDRVTVALDDFLTRLFTIRELTPEHGDEPWPDPAEVPRAALSLLDMWLTPSQPDVTEAIGIVDIHGQANWFSGALRSTGLPDVLLVSHDCNASVRGYLAVPEDDHRYPVLVVSTARYAESASLRLLLMEGNNLVEYSSDEMQVAADRASAAFTTLDFGRFPRGTSGEIHVQMLNAAGDPVTKSLIEPFRVVTQPVLLGTPQVA